MVVLDMVDYQRSLRCSHSDLHDRDCGFIAILPEIFLRLTATLHSSPERGLGSTPQLMTLLPRLFV